MLLATILALSLFHYGRQALMKRGEELELANWFRIGLIVSIALLALSSGVPKSRQAVMWLSYATVGALGYLIYTRAALSTLKPIFLALSPLLVVNFIESVVALISKSFYKEWSNYFEVAELLAFIWMIAMLISNNKQKKALEKERLKNEQKEREYKITEELKAALEVQVNERTAQLTQQKQELEQTLQELTATQAQLLHSEKMASLGELTAGIAHEIQNPLNFVNNFSEVSNELIAEMKEEILKGNFEEVNAIAADVQQNLEKIAHHGKRADAIVKGMLQHSRKSNGQKEPTDINALCDEYLRLAYHGLKAKEKTFNAKFLSDFDESIGKVNVVPQDFGRVILNLLTNAFYAVDQKQRASQNSPEVNSPPYEPTVTVSTKLVNTALATQAIHISITDNGKGISDKIVDKIFQPFFTTKPTGQGTGLGLSMSYDIITKGHGGELKVTSQEGEGSTFLIILPI